MKYHHANKGQPEFGFYADLKALSPWGDAVKALADHAQKGDRRDWTIEPEKLIARARANLNGEPKNEALTKAVLDLLTALQLRHLRLGGSSPASTTS